MASAFVAAVFRVDAEIPSLELGCLCGLQRQSPKWPPWSSFSSEKFGLESRAHTSYRELQVLGI